MPTSLNFSKIFLKLVTALMISTGASIAGEVNYLSSNLKDQGWEEITFEGKQPNRFTSCGKECIKINTMVSVSMIGRKIDINLTQTPILSWEWQIEKPAVASDLTNRGKDDRAVALYVTFPYDANHASFAENLLRPLVELKQGRDAPGRVISYVWGGLGETGEVIDSPLFSSAGAIIIRRNQRDKTGEWLSERVNVALDYHRIFGILPTKINNILIAGDSDDTHTTNQALVRYMRFSTRKTK
tara:strand:- start:1648 stop:2373 length:726 start_codon:yes stop_codon:yes gene_type:complete